MNTGWNFGTYFPAKVANLGDSCLDKFAENQPLAQRMEHTLCGFS